MTPAQGRRAAVPLRQHRYGLLDVEVEPGTVAVFGEKRADRPDVFAVPSEARLHAGLLGGTRLVGERPRSSRGLAVH